MTISKLAFGLKLSAVLAPLAVALSACGGGDERTVVVTPQPGQTVIVPPSGTPRLCAPGSRDC